MAWIAAAAGCASAPPAAVQPQLDRPIVLQTSTGEIHGALDLPGSRPPVPVALIVAGSGPTDRDGNVAGFPGANNSYRMLAEGLAQRGIATVRYDKRGIAASAPAAASEADLRFEHYVGDAADWVRMLREDPRFSSITVVGHSEGSLVGMLAARDAGADAFVSLAGIARPAGEVLRDQLRPSLGDDLFQRSERILRELEAGRTSDSVPPELAVLFRPSVQPYLVSWLRYRPAEEIATLRIPVLVVQGTTDVQVAVSEAEELASALPSAQLEVIEGMNHVLKRVSGGVAEQQPSYFDPSLPIVDELVEVVADFVHSVDAE